MRNLRRLGGQPAAAMWALVAALPLFLGACTFVPDWLYPTDLFESDKAPTTVAQGKSTGSDSFPKLSSVPDAAPKITATDTQAELRATLAADRDSAKYSGQRLAVGPEKDAGVAKMPSVAVGAVPSQAPELEKLADATTAQTVAQAPRSAESTTPQSTKSAFRFTQFDTKAAAKPNTQLSARTSELVAIIYFSYGSTALNRNDREVLHGVAELQKLHGGTVRVIGHASARTGTSDSVRHRLANFETSLQRANAVAAQLVRLGVAREKVAAEAKADSQPVYHEFMPTGEAGNRRAEIFLEN